MASPQNAATAGGENSRGPYPSFEQAQQTGQAPQRNPIIFRLKQNWFLKPRWEDAVYVKDDDSDYGPVSQYYDSATGSLHEISSSPISEPKVSSITVYEYEFGRVEEEFQASHDECIHDIWADPRSFNPAWVEFEIPEGYDMDDEERLSLPELKKLRCCGIPCPSNRSVSVTVRASPSGPGYVTIHDFITTVHPWLISLGDELLIAYNLFNPPEPSTQPHRLGNLWIRWPFLCKVQLVERKIFTRPIHDGRGYGQELPSQMAGGS